MIEPGHNFLKIKETLPHLAGGRNIDLLTVSKTQSSDAIRCLATLGQRHFGENYVQEGCAKRAALNDLDLTWHLIGPLQSNKCREAAKCFDWVQSVDRLKLISLLAQAREDARPPLNILVQVNVGNEATKSGCAADQIENLAAHINAQPRLRLRGLMAIPTPWAEPERRREDFHRMHTLFEKLRCGYPDIDTLSMGMSDDYELAIAEGATMVRIGSAIFGTRAVRSSTPASGEST